MWVLWQGVDGGGLDGEEVVAVVLQQVVLAVVTPRGRLVLDKGVLARVIVDVFLDFFLPMEDASFGNTAVHHGISWIDQRLEMSHINRLEIVKLEDSGNEAVVVHTPMQGILPTCIILVATPEAGA